MRTATMRLMGCLCNLIEREGGVGGISSGSGSIVLGDIVVKKEVRHTHGCGPGPGVVSVYSVEVVFI